jgi:hypothetical protein
MKTLNKQASKVMDVLVASMNGGDHVKIANNKSKSIMPVVVERLESYLIGTRYSVAHYYTQNGDAMRDPEMCFMHTTRGDWIPLYFLQDNIGCEQESVWYDDIQERWLVKPRMQADHAKFANMWMKNIKDQQRL